MLTNIIFWIVFGGLAGWIASMIMNTDEEQGFVANVVVGIIGAVIGGFIMRMLTNSEEFDTFSLGGFLVAILGAIILLFLVKSLSRDRGV